MTDDIEINFQWSRLEQLRHSAGRRFLFGEALLILRHLYSERESGRPSAEVGHGTFESECIRRGWKPRTVRALIADYEIEWSRLIGNAKAGAYTTAEKRKASRARAERSKNVMHDSSVELADDFARFARLLPYSAAKAAYREAAKCFHPDRGGNAGSMVLLNELWSRLKSFYEESHSCSTTQAQEETIQ